MNMSTRVRRSILAVVVTGGIGLIAACSGSDIGSDKGPASIKPTRLPVSDASVGAAEPCVAVTNGVDTATLGVTDVWPSAGGGGYSVRVHDLRPCNPSSPGRPDSGPLCAVGFPWRAAATADADLAALGAVEVRWKHLVKTADIFVNETIVSFAGPGPGSAGGAQLVRESIDCGHGVSAGQGTDPNRTRWLRTQSGSRVALVESGSRLVAVEFGDPSLKQAQLQAVVSKAMNLTVNLG